MNIVVVGTGYVGLVSGTCFAEFGIQVACIDKDLNKIDSLKNGKVPIYEPGLDILLKKQIDAKRISFSSDLKTAAQEADAIFIAVGTPTNPNTREADLKYVHAVAKEIAPLLDSYKVVVTKSTVPVGTAKEIREIILQENPDAQFDMVSNPEFLREGAAIEDFMRPDRVVVGVETERAKKVMSLIYRPLYINKTPIVFVSLETSELIKYASNAFLATKISFINEMADLCEATGANIQDLSHGMGLDKRIGSKFLHAGPGYGGSCFPKDTLALEQTGIKADARQTIVEQVITVNKKRQENMAEKIIKACGGSVDKKKIGILGIAFKPNTDDVRDAPSLTIIPILQKMGAEISAHDPEAKEQANQILENIQWQNDPYSVADNADALVILTEWNEYRALDLKRIKSLLKENTVVDLRNIYTLEEAEEHGFNYFSVGRRNISPK